MKARLISLLVCWVRLVTGRPILTLLCAAVLVVSAGLYAGSTLRLQGDVTELVSADAEFLRNYGTYKATFPQHRRLNVVVIDGADARRAREAEARLLEGMAARPGLFPRVYAPAADPFIARHALLFLGPARLEALVDSLAAAQPALAILARDPTLRGISDLFTRAADGDGNADALAPLAGIVATTAQGVSEGRARAPSWGEAMLGDAVPVRRLIVFQGSLADDDGARARDQAAAVRVVVEKAGLTPENGITVRMTGRGPLSSSELESAVSSIQLVGLLSLGLVALLLWVGLGSLRAIGAALVTLVSGLVLTAAFAAVAVGSLNVLSLTFAVLFIGLGIDFAIHLILRRTRETPDAAAPSWPDIVRGVGPTISLCGLTTAVAFLAFWPTRFQGLAELGLISAAGMLIAVAASFTILPPLLDLLRVEPRAGHSRAAAQPVWVAGVGGALARFAKPVSIGAVVLLVCGAAIGLQVRFDFNSLNLQDRDSEAVRTLTDLHADGTITPYSLTVAAPDLAAAEDIAAALRTLPRVGEVKTLRDFVPDGQEASLAILDSAQVILGPAVMFGRAVPPPDDPERQAAVMQLMEAGRTLAARGEAGGYADMVSALSNLRADDLRSLEALLAEDFVESLEMLREALAPGRVSLDSLPPDLVARETGTGGEVRVVALPRDDLRDFEALAAFVDEVHERFPAATGRPALEAGVGGIVVDAFRQAFITAGIAILLVLLVTLRSGVDALLVMIPLLLAASLTAAVMTLVGLPLNVANVIVLPLLLGMGVDNGLHVVGRFRETGSLNDVFRSSTPRAVVTSALTTLLSFVALAFAEHRGMSSMGVLLAIAIGFILFATLVVLPALLAWRAGKPLKS